MKTNFFEVEWANLKLQFVHLCGRPRQTEENTKFQSSGEIERAHEFEVGGDNYNDSRIDSGKFTDK